MSEKMYDAKDWLIVEKGYKPQQRLISESIFSVGNGYLGTRGAFDEAEPGQGSLMGTYAAGLFDDFQSGNEWVSELVNLPNPWRLQLEIDGEPVTMKGKVSQFERVLDMQAATMTRTFVYTTKGRARCRVSIVRFVSMARKHIAAQRVTVEALDKPCKVRFTAGIEGRVGNIDWGGRTYEIGNVGIFHLDTLKTSSWLKDGGSLLVRTKNTKIEIAEAFRTALKDASGEAIKAAAKQTAQAGLPDCVYTVTVKPGAPVTLEKVAALATSRDPRERGSAMKRAQQQCRDAFQDGYDALLKEQRRSLAKTWAHTDVKITGNAYDQAAVRLSMFHLIMSNAADDSDANIGSRGLTAETHRGSCFWDTELFMFPYYIYSDPEAARNLMLYRYKRLDGAREKARKHMFAGAMYPWMSAYDGREQATNWEYGDLSVHITSDIAYALNHYVTATGDDEFMAMGGTEMLAETARFWMSRIVWDADNKQYVMPAVKGPNEYDGVVYNNLYTNWMTGKNLLGAIAALKWLQKNHKDKYAKLVKRLKVTPQEMASWARAAKLLKLPYDKKRKLWVEDDNFMTKIPLDVPALKKQLGKRMMTAALPYDIIVSRRVVKQADVLLLMYLYPDAFSPEEVKTAYKFYEPLTVHDSSLSHNTYAIMGVRVGDMAKAYEHFQETAYLDLEDRAGNSDGGMHSACCGGTWQSVVFGFAGVRVVNGKVTIQPHLPPAWKAVSFQLNVRGRWLKVEVDRTGGKVTDAQTGKLIAQGKAMK